MFDKVKSLLDSKKTYLVALAAAATAIAAWVDGQIDGAALVTALFVAAGTITMRAGIKKSGA